ncbi:chloride channel protein, partial [Halocaridina rubra]
IIHAIALHITGYDEKGRMMRRALARYLNLSLVLILRSISSAVKKRFPTLEHLVEAGFITSTELGIFNLVPNKEFNTYWVPCTWFTALLRDIKSQKRIPDPMGIKHIMEEFNEFRQKCGLLWSYDWVSIPLVYTQEFSEFRGKCGMLWCYDWVSLPLVYTQVVTIATYAFFLAAIVGRQFVEKSTMPYKQRIDLYIPFFTLLQFFFYMGLLKVAEQLINPFGDDDEDFELNWIIDRHMKVSYLIVDTLLLRTPPLAKDIFYDDECPVLPYTEASAEFKKRTYRGSVANMVIPEEKQNLILPDIQEEGEEDNPSNLNSQMPSLKSSVSNIGGSKDQRSLSVPDDALILVGGSPTPRDSRRESAKSQTVSRSASRRLGTAGSKGIGSALVAIGSHQGFLATDPEKISLASISGLAEQAADTPVRDRLPDDLDYLILPPTTWGRTFECDAVALDMSGLTDDEDIGKSKAKGKGAFRLPASLKAKMAVKKKPVITWRPYIRQVDRTQGLPEELQGEFPEELPDDLKGESPGEIPPFVVEDECAFMWRTVEDDNISSKTSMSAPSEDQLLDSVYQDTPFLAHYNNVKPHTQEHRPTTLDLPQIVSGFQPHQIQPKRYAGVRRARYRTKGRIRCQYCSMPSLGRVPIESYLLTSLIRSVSESSVFQNALARRLSTVNRSQDRSRPVSFKTCPSPGSLDSSKLPVMDRQSSSLASECFKDVP